MSFTSSSFLRSLYYKRYTVVGIGESKLVLDFIFLCNKTTNKHF